jgi:hypothetical protein
MHSSSDGQREDNKNCNDQTADVATSASDDQEEKIDGTHQSPSATTNASDKADRVKRKRNPFPPPRK